MTMEFTYSHAHLTHNEQQKLHCDVTASQAFICE